jgi:hypothetical protein
MHHSFLLTTGRIQQTSDLFFTTGRSCQFSSGFLRAPIIG